MDIGGWDHTVVVDFVANFLVLDRLDMVLNMVNVLVECNSSIMSQRPRTTQHANYLPHRAGVDAQPLQSQDGARLGG